MPIQPGDRIPNVPLEAVTGGPTRTLSTADIFAGKRVVLFGVPGAFTPTCSDSHLPGFEVRGWEILAKGIDTIACVAVNDAFVMRAWARARGIDAEILMLADGNGEFVRSLGLELDLSHLRMQLRSQRFAAIIEDGVVRTLHVEPDYSSVTVSSAEAIVAELGALAADTGLPPAGGPVRDG